MSIVTRTASRQILRRRFFPNDLHHLTALRNTMPPANNTPLTFHHAIAQDIPAVFKLYERDEHSERLRLHAFERLRVLVQAIGINEEYDLVDNSLSTLQDSPRFYNAPLECTIVDKARPEGISSVHGGEALPLAYDAIALAKYLGEHGYSGTFIDTKPDVLGYNATDATALHQPPLEQPEPAWGELSTPFSSLFNVLPPTLRIKPETTEHPEIHLSPSHPSHQLRWNMLKKLYESSAAFRMLSSFFWLWLRAHGVERYSWTTCAFLVMYYLQAQHKPPNPPEPDAQSEPQEIWNRIDCHPNLEYERLVVPQTPHIADPNLQDSLLYSFFAFWDSPLSLPYNQLLNPLHGTCTPREDKYKGNGKDLKEAQVTKDLQKRSKRAAKDAFWCYNPLVLIDPFISHHNLAHTVTKHALHLTFYTAHLAANTLKAGLPVIELFATKEERSSEVWETEGVSSNHRAPTLSFGLRRMYHSSAGAETKDRPPEIRAPPEVPQDVRRARWQTINRVNTVIRQQYGTKYSVVCFGSTHYGVDSPASDLDLVILDADRKDGFRPGVASQSLPVVYNVKGLAQTLRKWDFHVIQVIPTASVPIVKFEDPRTGLACDINVNDRLGLYNTRLIAQYCALSPLLRPMLVLLKKWAKSLGLNNPAGARGGAATFSSYSLTLMTIGFLQTHDLLPNLQAGLPPFEEEGAFWLRDRSKRLRCDPRFNRLSDWTPPSDTNIRDLREGLSAWFRFWGHQFAYSKDVMSIRDGGVVPRSEKAEATVTEAKQRKKRAGKREKQDKRDRKLVAKLIRRDRDGGIPLRLEELSTDQLAIFHELVGIPDASVIGEGSEVADAVEEESVVVDSPAVDDPDAVALEEMEETDLQHGKQPRSWARTPMVIADPFIVSKNATMSIPVRVIERFTAECRRALLLLTAGAEFKETLGDGSLLPAGGSQRRGRRDRAGRRPRGRSRSKSPNRSASKKRSKSKSSTGSKSRDAIGGST